MKKVLFVILLFAVTSAIGQSKTDTTKQKQPDNYVLVGQVVDFQLLYKALNSPDDVSKNEVRALLAWIVKIQVLPTTKKDDDDKKPKVKN